MDDLIIEIAKQVPSLAVLAFIVWTFIKFLTQANTAVQDMHRECHSTQAQAAHAMAQNTAALDGLSDRLDEWAEHRPTNGRG